MATKQVRPAELADYLVGRGQRFVTTDEVASLLGVAPAEVRNSLRRSREHGRMLSITKGAWVPVPAQHRSAGAPPAEDFIDHLMTFLGHAYYVGFLSAAAMHGASHQSPMVFQVVTPAVLRDRTIGRNRLRFIRRTDAAQRATQRRTVTTGQVTLSTPEITVLDLVDAPLLGAGLSNVATIIAQFLDDELIDPERLASQATQYPLAVAQRTGYLIETMAEAIDRTIDLDPLHALVAHRATVSLDPHLPGRGERIDRWRVVANTDVEPEL